MKKWLQRRKQRGSFEMLFKELVSEDKQLFLNYLRMTPDLFSFLLNKITPIIAKKDSHLRESIAPGARLEATLLFLANGMSYSSLRYSTRISVSSLSFIIPETCEAIYRVLKNEYLKVRLF